MQHTTPDIATRRGTYTELREFLKEVTETALLPWEPRTERTADNKRVLLDRVDEALGTKKAADIGVLKDVLCDVRQHCLESWRPQTRQEENLQADMIERLEAIVPTPAPKSVPIPKRPVKAAFANSN